MNDFLVLLIILTAAVPIVFMTTKEQRDLRKVRNTILKAIRSCNDIPSTTCMAALVELTVDTAVALCGPRNGVEAICRTVNLLMETKHKGK